MKIESFTSSVQVNPNANFSAYESNFIIVHLLHFLQSHWVIKLCFAYPKWY